MGVAGVIGCPIEKEKKLTHLGSSSILRRLGDQTRKRGRCLCSPVIAEGSSSLSITNMPRDFFYFILLRMACNERNKKLQMTLMS